MAEDSADTIIDMADQSDMVNDARTQVYIVFYH
jgi:hypothetical protein